MEKTLKTHTAAKSEPLTPLIDVLFILMMALAMNVKAESPDLVVLPSGGTGESPRQLTPTESKSLPTVVVLGDGKLTLNGQEIAASTLVARVSKLVDPVKRSVLLKIGKSALHQSLLDTQARLTAAGLNVLRVANQPSDPKP